MNRLTVICVCCLAFLSCGKPKSAVEGQQESQGKNAPQTSGKGEGEKGESNAVEMNSEAQQRAGVAVTPAAIAPMTQYLQVTGSVQPMDSSLRTFGLWRAAVWRNPRANRDRAAGRAGAGPNR
jgi:hypothetical protein